MGTLEGTFDTKLHEAVRCSDIDEVRVALGQGYDPNLIGLFQWSSLHEAAYNGNVAILKLLLGKKGDPNKPDQIEQKTAMHYATEQGNIECLKLLLAAGGRHNVRNESDPNKPDQIEQKTAMHYATEQGNIECLKLLLAAGGRHDVRDESGRDCLDMATPSGRKILERLKMRDLMLSPPEDDDDDEIAPCEKPAIADDCSSITSSLTSSRRSSSTQNPALGYMHLSVEYHSVKSSIKIRVWQLTDLFLPPSNTSMINSIYVKSYLAPDKKKDTKRKTEEIRIDNSESHIHTKKQKKSSTQHVFTPSSFRFTRPLEYSGIKPETIKEKHLSIEVCITQRYSHRSFLIGMVNMSLRNAVKKIVKEKLPLIPCMNHTIPATMKVYSASELSIANVFYSNPNFKLDLPDDYDSASTKAVSNPNLQPDKYSPSTEVNMNHEYRTVPHVPKLDLNPALDESGYSSELHISVPGDLESPDSDSHSSLKSSGKGYKSVNFEDNKSKTVNVLESVREQGTGVTRYHMGIPVTDLDEEEDGEIQAIVSTQPQTPHTAEQPSSRPETPTWDYYDMPKEVVTEEAPTSPWKEGAAPVMLPMLTSMHNVHSDEGSVPSVKPDVPSGLTLGKLLSSGKKSLKKNKSPKPGHAVAQVPEIVVSNVEQVKDVKIDTKLAPKPVTEVPSIKIEKSEPVKSVAVAMETRPVTKTEEKLKVHKKDKKKTKSPEEHKVIIGSEEECSDKATGVETDRPQTREKTSRLSSFRAKLKKVRKGSSKEGGSKPDEKSRKTTPLLKGTEAADRKSSFPGGAVRVSADVTDLTTPTSSRSRKDSEVSSNTSFVVDMESLSFASADSHVVDLDNEVSITELPEDSQLFSHMSESSLKFDDVESGLESYELPERVSPTKYMVPMQVFMDDDTSCDESLATDRSTNEALTEL